MKGLTKAALERNRVTAIALLVIALVGISSYAHLPRNDMPPFTIRVASVVTRFPGAGPERIEQLVTDKIEKVVQELPEVKTIKSESRTGLSVVNVELYASVDEDGLQPVWDRLRRKLDTLKPDLPDGIDGPNLEDDDIGVVYGIVVGLQSDGFSFVEMKHYADALKDILIKLPNAAQVKLSGDQEERVFIEFRGSTLAELGVTPGRLENALRATNIIYPGGDVVLGRERVILEPTGNFNSLDELKDTLIPVGNRAMRLRDIATVRRGYITPRRSAVRLDGLPAIALHVALKERANITALGKEVDAALANFEKNLPIGLSLRRVASQDHEVVQSVSDFVSNLQQAIVVVLLVMLAFLGLRTGVVVASLIPGALVMTLALMGVLGQGLNQVSLAALIMALGMLVDNAIVMAEAMSVRMEEGNSAFQAAIGAAQELAVPLLISSLTTSAAFLAFYLAESTMGEIVSPLFVVISTALLCSWVMALVMVPLLGVAMMRVNAKKDPNKGPMAAAGRIYERVLNATLKRPKSFVALILALFVASLASFGALPFLFFPDSDRALVTVDVRLPLGTNIETTEATVAKLETFMRDTLLGMGETPALVDNWASFVGEGPPSYDLGYQPGQANSAYAHLLVNTVHGDANGEVIAQLDAFAFNHLPDADVEVKRLAGGGSSGAPVDVRLFGDDPDTLFRLMVPIKAKLATIAGTKNIGDSWGPRIKKFVVDIDDVKAKRAGLTNQDVAVSLQTELTGFRTGELRFGSDLIPIFMRSEDAGEKTLQELEGAPIAAQSSGKSVPLSQLAELEPRWQYATIHRRDLNRTLSVSSYLQAGYNARDITDTLLPWLEEEAQKWPVGYSFELGGEAENSQEGMQSIGEKLPLAAFIILLLLILQFNSIRKTTIVLSTIPLGVTGVIFGLHAFDSYFGFFAFLGIISLAGIVINNAIVLIDRIAIELEAGREPFEAVIAAAVQRFRPIILTTCTTVFGLIPLYLGGGVMWEPMAVGIMVGLLFATLITLLFVPVLYCLFYRVGRSCSQST